MVSHRLSSLLCTACRTTSDLFNPLLRSAKAAQRIRAYHPAWRLRQENVQQRYGTANAPPPHLSSKKGDGPVLPTQPLSVKTKAPLELEGGVRQSDQDDEKTVQAEAKAQPVAINHKSDTATAEKQQQTTTDESAAKSPMSDPMLDSADALPPREAPATSLFVDDKPLDTILNSVPDPDQPRQKHQQLDDDDEPHAEEHHDKTFDEHSPPVKAPHIDRPRYVHHFDTYSLVKRLKENNWNESRAITTMKAVRLMLADNTNLAKEALVSKSHLENEAYLFKAACAELRTEVTSRRKSEQEKMRTERNQLQHEVDILSQRLSQESGTLKDDLKGMFDDRKMAVRNEQRDMESKIQQLNYRITVELQADAKSEIEELRMIMVRRVIFTLAFVVLTVIGSLKLSSDAAAAEASKKSSSNSSSSSTSSGGMQTSSGTQTDFGNDVMKTAPSRAGTGEMLVIAGDGYGSPAYVSLG